jgi:hypothetical protein
MKKAKKKMDKIDKDSPNYQFGVVITKLDALDNKITTFAETQGKINEKNDNRIKCLETFQIKSVAVISAIGLVAGFIGAVVKEFLPFFK